MASFAGPPYFLLGMGLFFSLTSAIAFFAMLRQGMQSWIQRYATRTIPPLEARQMLVPYWGICFGIWLIFTAVIGWFGVPILFSFLVALVLTLVLAQWVWSEIGDFMGRRVVRSYAAASAQVSHQGWGKHA